MVNGDLPNDLRGPKGSFGPPMLYLPEAKA